MRVVVRLGLVDVLNHILSVPTVLERCACNIYHSLPKMSRNVDFF